MKKYILLPFLFLAFFCSVQKAFAQPSLCVVEDYVGPLTLGTEVCVEVRVNDFTDLTSMNFNLLFDEDKVQFSSVNIAPATLAMMNNYGMADIDQSDAANGNILFDWGNPTQPGSTLADGMALFEICFITLDDLGFSELDLVANTVTRTISGNFNIWTDSGNYSIKDGWIQLGEDPLSITIPDVAGLQGETVCMNFTVDNFSEMLAVQMSIHYDADALNLISSDGVEPMTGGSFDLQVPEAGTITMSWVDNDGEDGITIPDGSSFIQLCFELIGDCTMTFPVFIDDNPTITEAVSVPCLAAESPDIDCGIYTFPGSVTIDCIQPGAPSLCIPNVSDICPGESFEMAVTTQDFTSIRQMDFSLNWNANILQLDDIVESTELNGFIINPNVGGGFATCTWDAGVFPETLNDGETLFTLFFTVVGGGGSSSTVSVTSNPTDIFFSDESGANAEDLGYNSCNALFQACSPTGITVSGSNETVDPGAPVCVDVTVQDFDNITELAFSMDWDPGVMDFVEFNNFNLPGLSAADFDLSGSNFGFACLDAWSSPTGVDIPDGSTIFSVCFEGENNPLACGALNFGNSPCGQVVMQEDVGFDIGMNSNPGEVCINNPAQFITSGSSVGGSLGSFVCVDVAVQNFQNLSDMEYSVNWNPTLLDFLNLENPGTLTNLNSNSFDETDVENGNLTVNWETPGLNGTTLADGTIIYSICFQIIGDLSGCTPVSFTGNPLPITVQNNNSNTNIGMTANNGEVCPVQALNLSADITDVSCTTATPCDGAIDVTVTGGNGDYEYTWSGPGITDANANNEDQTNLCFGSYFLNVTDVSTSLVIEELFEVGTSPLAPIAIAGPDTTKNCGLNTLVFDVSDNGTSVGSQFSYQWEAGSNNIVIIDGAETLTPEVGGTGGSIILTVTNDDTGCSVQDDLFISGAVSPSANAGADVEYDCLNDEVELDGTGSEQGSNISIVWTTEAGGSIEAGTETDYEPSAMSPGAYIINVTNESNNCISQDTVQVIDIRTEPTAEAGADGIIDCGNDTVNLDGTGSTTENTTFSWTTASGAEVFVNPTSLTDAQTNVTGVHYIIVTNETNGCTAVDSMFVNMDMGVPDGSAGTNRDFFCDTETVTLAGTAPTEAGDYSYAWAGPATATILDGTTLTPTVDMPGGYFLTVTNNTTSCDAVFSVQVTDMTAPPLAEAGEGSEINCATASVTLDGSDSDEDMEYAWTNADGTMTGIESGVTTLTPVINQAGSYLLTVTNPLTQCTATDDVTVAQGSGEPMAVIAATDDFFNCTTDAITLDATGSTSGADYEYTWTGDCIDDLTDEQMPVISCAGTYTLLVTDTVLNCVSQIAEITLTEDTQNPILATENNVLIECGESEVILDASASSQGDDFAVEWTALSGMIIDGGTTLTPTVTAGNYGVTIINTLNGCDVVGNVIVTGNSVIANAGMNAQISCTGGDAQLDGSESTEGATYAWTFEDGTTTGITGADTATPTVSLVGTYTLTVTDETGGCSATDEVQVIGTQPPFADAGADVPLTCSDEFVTLDGSASEAADDITYAWTTADGNFLGTDLSELMQDVDAVGEYVLTLTRADGCFSIDTVLVFADAGDLPPAVADVEHDICETTASVTGNLPEGSTGMWTSNEPGITFENAEAGVTAAGNLPGGEALLIWTLSTEGCPNYDADTVLVVTEYTPNAVDDTVDMLPGETEITFDVFENDNTANIPSFGFDLIGEPTLGSIIDNPGDGNLTFQTEIGLAGAAVFEYLICNTNCPSLCDTATITVNLDGELDFDDLPNTITPNGDGLNDILIFDVLNTGDYPNSSIIVFNRYGDEVYTASPYNNDWGGTYDGKLLPQSTYYYVLRLNLGDGEVVKGDLTILR